MLRYLIYSTFLATSLAYRVFEYTEAQCLGTQPGKHHLSGPTACTKLNASSLLVKIDNVYDEYYLVNVFENEDCTGTQIGIISNMNGCLDQHATVNDSIGKSVQVVRSSKGNAVSKNKGFDTGYLYNLPTENQEEMKVPVWHGGFQTIPKSNTSENGTYLDQAFNLWFDFFDKIPCDTLSKTTLNPLDIRWFQWANCKSNSIRAGVIDLWEGLNHAQLIQCYDYVVERVVNGIRVITTLAAGTERKTTGEIAKDLVNSASRQGLIKATYVVEDEEGNTFEIELRRKSSD